MTKARTLAIAAACLAAAPPLAAQSSTSWSAWYGCWHAVGAPSNEKLCVDPDGDGVRMTTVVDGQVRAETRIVADYRARDVAQEDCRGTERARWSNDRRRVFLTSSLSCGNGRRESSGIMAFTDPSHWVSVQAVTYDGETATRRTQYEALESPGVLARDVRMFAASSVNEGDVIEAGRYVDDAAVQEWLNAAESDYAVNGGSAMDMMNRGGTAVVYRDRPVYYPRNYHSTHIDIVFSRYNPWGYGWWGWRVYRPVYYVNRYHYSRPPVIIRHNDSYRPPRRDYDRDRDRVRRDDGSRVTRDGYTQNRDKAKPAPSQSNTQNDRHVTTTSSSSSSRNDSGSSSSSKNEGRTARRRN